MGKILGLDIGISSVGVGLVDDEYHILEAVSDIFPEANAAENVKRREFRQGRRMKRRLHTRLYDFGVLWNKYRFSFPQELANNPLELRVKGLSEEITMEEIYVVLKNNLKHRGISYLEDALDDTQKEGSAYARSLAINQRELVNKLPCEIQYERLLKYGAYRGEITVDENGEKITLSNVFTVNEYRKEIDRLFEKQREFHPEICDDFISEFIEIFNRKREYYEGPGNEKSRTDYGRFTTKRDENGEYITEDNIFEKLIGNCSVYPDERRAAWASYTAQEFNLLNDLNNLTINGRKLEAEEKKSIIKTVKESKTVNMLKIIKAVMGEDILSLEGARVDAKDKEEFHSFEVYRKMRSALEGIDVDIQSFDTDILDEIGYILTINTDKESIIKAFNSSFVTLDDFVIEVLIGLRKKNGSLFSKWQSFSLKIMRELIPELYEQPKNQMVLLTEMGIQKSKREQYAGLKYIPAASIIENIYNPVVRRSIKVSINAVNAIIKKYGELDTIVIEMPRDRNSEEEKQRINEENKRNRNELPTIEKKLKDEYGIAISDATYKNKKNLRLKLKLWNEQAGKCLYSGKAIDIEDLINNPELFEIDHALPLSISFDDSRTNKVLVYRTENQKKGNRTPYMYLSGLTRFWGYDEYETYVKSLKLPSSKTKKLLFKQDINKVEVLQGFIQRNINDTRYASRVVLNAMQEFFAANGKDTKVKVINGAFTHQMRANLRLDKNREESNAHHAIDAILIAYSQMGYDAYHKLQGSVIDFETGEILDNDRINSVISDDNYKKTLYEDKWLDIRKGIAVAEHSVKYWYMIDKKCNRQLCDQTIYGTRDIDGIVTKVSKTKSIYTKEGLEALKKRIDKPECFLMYRNDPKTWEALIHIMNEYKDAVNPFVQYEKETGDYLRKYAKDHRGPRIETLKYLDGEVGSCVDISHKYGHEAGSKKVILGSLNPYRMDVYYNVNTKLYYFVGVRYSDICMKKGRLQIDEAAYARILVNEKMIEEGQNRSDLESSGFEFCLSFYKHELIRYEKNGEIFTARFWSRTKPKDRNYIEVHPIDKTLFQNRNDGVVGLSKTTMVSKIRTDILGNKYECKKEPFELYC